LKLSIEFGFAILPATWRVFFWSKKLLSGSWRTAPIYRQESLFFVGEAFSLDNRPPPAEKAAPTKNMGVTQISFLGRTA